MIITVLQVRCFFIEKCLLKLNKAACIRHMLSIVPFYYTFKKTHPSFAWSSLRKRRQLSIQTNSGMHLWYINTALA
ncbi:hypothetical protein T07_6985 [Trichinella nelsoni]|uniref:Uncharacterized protein n=1 Tax=Trichinella nelsoni TaxID=6336 RepID=A0A0V0SJ30_9BILA|nr:hypothetical protein T07_6985 [Trichinella nelsoni]